MKFCAYKLKISACRKSRRHRRRELPKLNDEGRQGSMRTWLSMKTLTPTRCVKKQMVTQDSNTTWISLMKIKTETERRRGSVMIPIVAATEIDTAMSMIANMMMSTTVRRTQMAYSTEMKMALFAKVKVVGNVVAVAASVVNVAAIVAKTAEKTEETETA